MARNVRVFNANWQKRLYVVFQSMLVDKSSVGLDCLAQ